MSAITLARAIRDPRLLGGRVPWRSQQLDLLRTLDGPESLHVWCLGRQSGKSSMAAAAAVWNATLRSDLDEVLPVGEWRTTPVVSPTEEQSRNFISKAVANVEASPLIAAHADIRGDRIDFKIPRVDQHGKRFTAKTRILAMPASSKSIVGLTGSMVVVEEASRFNDATGGPADDKRIFEAIGPTLTVFGERSCTLIISSMYGESGAFFETLTQVQAGEIPNAVAVIATTQEMWPEISQDYLDAQRKKLGDEAFDREYNCVASTGAGSFFTNLGALDNDDSPVAPEDGRNWVCGQDAAFHRDLYGYAVVGESVHVPGQLVVGAMGAIKPGGKLRSFESRRKREDATLRAVWKAIEPYQPRVVADQANADAVKDYFQRMGAPTKIVSLTGPIQTAAFTSLRSRLDDGSLRLWKHTPLIEELRRVSVRGADRIYLRRQGDSHADIASALALAAYELRHATGTPEGKPVGGPSLSRSIEEALRGRAEGWPGKSGRSIINEMF
jgi:hypothetical protein